MDTPSLHRQPTSQLCITGLWKGCKGVVLGAPTSLKVSLGLCSGKRLLARFTSTAIAVRIQLVALMHACSAFSGLTTNRKVLPWVAPMRVRRTRTACAAV